MFITAQAPFHDDLRVYAVLSAIGLIALLSLSLLSEWHAPAFAGHNKTKTVEQPQEELSGTEEALKKGEELKSKAQDQLGKAEKGFEFFQKGDSFSQCIIATAAFGSELAPQVQFLRNFRDTQIMSTSAGSSFMSVFNAWYYSFSPHVADYERERPWLQQAVRGAIYPLIGILQISEVGYSSAEGEYGAVAAGFIASSMIGALYFWPFAISLRQVRAGRLDYRFVLSLIAVVFAFLAGSIITANMLALMLATSLFVLTILSISAVVSARMITLLVRKLHSLRPA